MSTTVALARWLILFEFRCRTRIRQNLGDRQPKVSSGALFLVLLLLTGSQFAGAQVLPRFEPPTVASGVIRLEVQGQAGQTYVVEVSSDLFHWSELKRASPTTDTFVVTDEVGTLDKRFYRLRRLVLSSLAPAEADVFAGDGVLLQVGSDSATSWIFSVNGVRGGNAQIGLIQSDPASPGAAFYAAPLAGTANDVTICAEDPNDPLRRLCATLHIRPLPATLVVRPASGLLTLGQQLIFTAGAEVPGVGYIPLNRVYWKLNGNLGGDAETGSIDLDGVYSAPLKMPATLPKPIQVGFSLTPEGPVLASAPVTVQALEVAPSFLVSLTNGPVGQLTAALVKTDGTRAPVPPADLTFISSLPAAASVDADGRVTIGDAYGQALIQVTHKPSGATDSARAESRANVFLFLDAYEVRTGDAIGEIYSGSALTELEVTRPRVLLDLKPKCRLFRFFKTDPFQRTFAATDSKSVRFTANDPLVKSYEPTGRIPQATGLTALVDAFDGSVEFGDQPGTGTVTVSYDDGYVRREMPMRLTFTRLELSATARGMTSGQPGQAYNGEWIQFDVIVRNPRGNQAFTGRTPIRITDGGESFIVQEDIAVLHEGATQLPLPTAEQETTQYAFTIPSSVEAFTLGRPRGVAQFRVSPRRAGLHKFRVAVMNDPGIPPLEVSVQVKSQCSASRRCPRHPTRC